MPNNWWHRLCDGYHEQFSFLCQQLVTVSLGSKLVEDVAVFLPIYDSASANTRNGGTTFLFDYLSDDKGLLNNAHLEQNVERKTL